jgi:hypothetical protein
MVSPAPLIVTATSISSISILITPISPMVALIATDTVFFATAHAPLVNPAGAIERLGVSSRFCSSDKAASGSSENRSLSRVLERTPTDLVGCRTTSPLAGGAVNVRRRPAPIRGPNGARIAESETKPLRGVGEDCVFWLRWGTPRQRDKSSWRARRGNVQPMTKCVSRCASATLRGFWSGAGSSV